MLFVIYSTDTSNVFGSNDDGGKMLWNNKEDLKFFKHKTTKVHSQNHKNAIIMGRNTANSLINHYGGPLKNRVNIVISKTFEHPDFMVFQTLDAGLQWCYSNVTTIENVFVIGGKQLIHETVQNYIPRRIYKTIVENNEYSISNKNKNLIYIDDKKFLEKYTIIKNKKVDENTNFLTYSYNTQNVDTQNVDTQNIDTQNVNEKQYLNLLMEVYLTGEYRQTRNGYTYSLFGKNLEFDLSTFPLLTTKKMFLRGIFEELKFFLLGQTDTNILKDKGVNIWNKNTSRIFLDSLGFKDRKTGDMGPMYGYQWRNFNGQNIDQLKNIIHELKTNVTSRRLLLTTYNPAQANEGVLYPCHGIVVQFYVIKKNRLSCIMHQRSADMFLGVPFNIASYALFVFVVCKLTNLQPYKLIMNFGDLHIYKEHIQQILEQYKRIPYQFPTLTINHELNSLDDIETFEFSHLTLNNYQSHPSIKAEMIA